MDYHLVFKMPVPMKITGRSSSITNSFVNSIIPAFIPTDSEIEQALLILGMDLNTVECIYCGANHTEWDHLRPIVLDKKPTGYVSEIQNLVPSCSKCNQSKGNKAWDKWITGSAKLSPKSRKIRDLKHRIETLTNYTNWKTPTKIDFETELDTSLWAKHWNNCEEIQKLLIEAQKIGKIGSGL